MGNARVNAGSFVRAAAARTFELPSCNQVGAC